MDAQGNASSCYFDYSPVCVFRTNNGLPENAENVINGHSDTNFSYLA